MIKVLKKFTKVEERDNQLIVDTTSQSKTWSKAFSPFFLGPIALPNGQSAHNLENAWQFSKVFPNYVDDNHEPSDSYYQWANNGFASKQAIRYPAGKDPITKRGYAPLYALWDDKKLNYIESRKTIYLPLYQKAVKQTAAWKKLKKLYQAGNDIILLDFDGYDHQSTNMTYWDVLNNEEKNMGHSFVIAMMLTYGQDFTLEDVEADHELQQSLATNIKTRKFEFKYGSLDPFI